MSHCRHSRERWRGRKEDLRSGRTKKNDAMVEGIAEGRAEVDRGGGEKRWSKGGRRTGGGLVLFGQRQKEAARGI